MNFQPGNAQHIGQRKEQQDAFAFSNPADRAFMAHGGLLAILADGMGGMENGRQASTLAVRTFLSEYEKKTESESIAEALDRAFQATFKTVGALNDGNARCGSTLIAAVAHDTGLHWVSIGDSHIYLLRDNTLTLLNREHNFGERLLDLAAQGNIGVAEVMQHPERDHLTSFLGMAGAPELVDRNAMPLRLQPGDQVVLCSDGVYRTISEEEIVASFAEKPARACELIREKVLGRNLQHQDNLTVLVIRCGEGAMDAAPAPASGGGRSKVLGAVIALLLAANVGAGALAWKMVSQARHQQTAPQPVKDVTTIQKEKPAEATPVRPAEGTRSKHDKKNESRT